MTHKSVVIEADGGSRGNPGPAAYGAVLKDADTGEVIAEDGSTIGIATNNVAEYSGLIAGLRLAAGVRARRRHRGPDGLQARGRADVGPLEDQAPRHAAAGERRPSRLAPFGTTYTWVPREQNKHADRLANEALDGERSGVTRRLSERTADSLIEEIESPETEPTPPPSPTAAGRRPGGPPTTLILVRHGVTPHTVEKRFSGGLASANPGLSDEGRDQIRATADWLAPIAEQIDAVIASPVRRTLESAEILAEVLGKTVDVEPGFAEMEFGTWDGKTFMDVAEQHKEELDAWLGSLDVAPGGGESFRDVEKRVLDGLQRLLDAHPGKTVVVVSHVTPIKILVGHAVTAPLDSVFRMELSPASVSVLAFYGGGEDGARAAGVDADVQRAPARPRRLRLAVLLAGSSG